MQEYATASVSNAVVKPAQPCENLLLELLGFGFLLPPSSSNKRFCQSLSSLTPMGIKSIGQNNLVCISVLTWFMGSFNCPPVARSKAEKLYLNKSLTGALALAS